MGMGIWTKVAENTTDGPFVGIQVHNQNFVYDQSVGKCLLYNPNFTTWSWDGTTWALEWTVSSHFPIDWTDGPQVVRAAVVYDKANQQVMLFGGFNGSSRDHQYTWDWGTATWTEIFPSPKPSARFDHAMAYDENLGKVVMFGGEISPGTMSSQTWTWDGTNWAQLTPATTPQARGRFPLVWDAGRQNLVMFGGRATTGSVPIVLDTTFVWDGTDWTELFPTTSPDPREDHDACYDACLRRVIMYGGTVSNPGAFVDDDTWAWDGSDWTDITSLAVSPNESEGLALAYFETRREAVLVMGTKAGAVIDGDTWVLPCTPRVQVMRWH